jgi:EAL domain-containing protein (putative c-di-GMP-specific phosphodiesterase class I)
VTPALLQDFAVRYQAPLATLVAEYDPDVSSIDLTDADGNAVGTVAWTPERPGEKALTHALLIASGALLAIGLLLVIGLGLLRRVMQHRAKAVAEAFEALQQEFTQIAPAPGLAAVPAAEDRLSQEADRALVGVTAASFDIEYQPIFDLRSEALIGVEGLLRWTNPDGTLLLEESLTPTQRALLLDRIGTLAIRRATEEVAILPGLMLTMAISPAQLQNPVFAEKVSATMRATNFPARRLQLCVDTALLPLIEAARGPIEDLRRAGVLLSLGDCAIAAGPLDYFEANLVDRVKLSSSLLSEGSAVRQAYVAASVDAARAAGIVATVTGVEDRAVVARLLRLGCREFQGDLFAASMGIAALTQLVLAPARPAEARQAG